MKQIMKFYFYAFVLSLFFFSCKNDTSKSTNTDVKNDDIENVSITSPTSNSNNHGDAPITLEDAPDEEKIIEEMTKSVEELPVNEKAKVKDINDTKLEKISEVDKKKEADLKKKIAEDKVKNSSNKGSSCDKILKKYNELANEFLSTSDMKLLVEMNKQTNDVFFAQCRKDATFEKNLADINKKVDDYLEAQ